MDKEQIQISKEDFTKFLKQQKRGTYNMLSVQAQMSSGLTREKYQTILKNYEKYMLEYKDTYNKEMRGE